MIPDPGCASAADDHPARLLSACFGPLSGVDEKLWLAPDAGQITVSKLAESFFGQLAIPAQSRQQRRLIEQLKRSRILLSHSDESFAHLWPGRIGFVENILVVAAQRHYLSITFSKVKQKPRVVEEHDSMAGILSSVEVGTGIAIGADAFGYSYGDRVKRLRVIPEPKPISIGIIGTQGTAQSGRGKILAVRERSGVKKMIAIA
jgi:hypothetical protein